MKYIIVSLMIAAVAYTGINMAYAEKTDACGCNPCECAPCNCG